MSAIHSPFPPASHTVMIKRFEAPIAMTWAAIELDRIARGLDVPKAPKSKRAPKSTGPRMVDGQDARLPSNLTPCTAARASITPTTAAQAAASRKRIMRDCSCRLCTLALHPALTFAEHAAFFPGAAERAEALMPFTQANVWGFERTDAERKAEREGRKEADAHEARRAAEGRSIWGFGRFA